MYKYLEYHELLIKIENIRIRQDVMDASYTFLPFFIDRCTQPRIELSRKVFIRYDPIIHGAAATTRPRLY